MIWRVGHNWPGRLRNVLSRGTIAGRPTGLTGAFVQFFQLARYFYPYHATTGMRGIAFERGGTP